MNKPLTLYTNPMSRGRMVRWMLEELNTTYDTVIVEYGPEMKGPEYLAINPMGKVPAIKHGDVVVTECAAICAYLADAFPEAGLAPDLKDRGSYYRWLFFAAGPVEHAVTNKTLKVELTDRQQGMVGYGSLSRVQNALEHALQQSAFVAGDKFTAADVYVGSHVYWALKYARLDSKPVFTDYVDRLGAREANRRAEELDGPTDM
ncbi:MAG: glutathione S-transferase family protein [Gammaproteobacteria bacterium]|nr:glutathione S-transferase family protein [Gammaproteobacteria bacterium]MYF03224.1 glutathione S-transferase family protein [Gammaproteobacteria bacterium]MYI77805.1 glutathione S-transferase family protein [Gammaproteobacteria bacterium]